MRQRSLHRRSWTVLGIIAALGLTTLVASGRPPAAEAQSFPRISGVGSSWSANAIDAMRVNVRQFGITVDYTPSGSTTGRRSFLQGTVDFAVSDIPFQFEPEDGSAPERPAAGSYAYIPATAGGLAFMYNLSIDGRRVTNLRLSGENVAKIFTGAITQWNDPALAADNPGLTLPARQIVPVVRTDGAGPSLNLTQWMIAQHGGLWQDYCERSGRAQNCGPTSFYPTISGMIAQAGDLGVAGYVSQGFAEGAIGYVNYSFALGAGFPVAKVLNAAGYYTEPTPENVAVSLLQARVNGVDNNRTDPEVFLTQDLAGVYNDTDPRSYPLSSYSYFILPTRVRGQFTEAEGRTLGAFAYYAMCQAQQQSASLGYSPLPINLVEASLEQIRLIPGVEVQDIAIETCNNPTFSPDGTNVLARDAAQPQACDRQGQSQCPDGTGGAADTPTPVDPPPAGGDGGAETADGVRGSFSVVEPSGPCITVANGGVSFGQLLAGNTDAVPGDRTTTVTSCTNQNQRLGVSISDAVAEARAAATLAARTCPITPTSPTNLQCSSPITASEFGYASTTSTNGGATQSVFMQEGSGSTFTDLDAETSRNYLHFVQAPGVGAPEEQFDFVITYTAIAR